MEREFKLKISEPVVRFIIMLVVSFGIMYGVGLSLGPTPTAFSVALLVTGIIALAGNIIFYCCWVTDQAEVKKSKKRGW